MKLSTLTLGLALSIASANAMASNIVFKPLTDDLETKTCLLAAEEGFESAKAMVKSTNTNFIKFNAGLICNGMSLSDFAEKYNQQEKDTLEPKPSIKLVAKHNNPASKVCLDALVIGEQAAREKHQIMEESIYCNEQRISSFVRKYSKKNIQVAVFSD